MAPARVRESDPMSLGAFLEVLGAGLELLGLGTVAWGIAETRQRFTDRSSLVRRAGSHAAVRCPLPQAEAPMRNPGNRLIQAWPFLEQGPSHGLTRSVGRHPPGGTDRARQAKGRGTRFLAQSAGRAYRHRREGANRRCRCARSQTHGGPRGISAKRSETRLLVVFDSSQ